ncbi:MAG: heme lyase CcmF/NrfE family subunit [Candidatus Marinimicrobia bacterium]|nr:heme lyase CcmF/NrfE family subunit [Candidatus Neomarinimicrobiota bacterium]
MVQLGGTLLQIAFLLGVVTLVASAWYVKTLDLRFYVGGRRSLMTACGLVLIATATLVQQLMVGNYALEYVARYSSRATEGLYKIAGLWAGMEGSLLFWAAILSIYILLVSYSNRSANRSLMPYVNMVFAVVLLFFLLVIVNFENPFTLLPAGTTIEARGGTGLNPQLTHPAMLIHPPMLYLGYVGFVVPFAFAVAALITNRLDATWIRSTRVWTLWPWLFLGVGVILGGYWAYAELGWGGYWAWDPVENASFLPWLTGTAYLHSVIIQEKKNMLRMWNVILIMITFILTIFGTYLTRSGILSSVHAFASTDLGIWFFGFVVLIIAFCTALLIWRKDELTSTSQLESFTSRESGFLFNNMLFLALTMAILWGTMFPILSEAVRGIQITVGSPYFNRITSPIGMLLLAMIGVGPLLAWRKTSRSTLLRNFKWPVSTGLAAMAVAMFLGVRKFYPALTLGLVVFVFTGIVLEVFHGVTARKRMTGEGTWTALLSMVDKNRTRYGGYIVHIGILLMFIGFAGRAFTKEQDVSLGKGESMVLGGYTFTLDNFYTQQRPTHTAFVADVAVTREHKPVTMLHPERRIYANFEETPNTEVAIYSRPLQDIYAIVGGMNPDTQKIVLKIMLNPLVQMVWIGGFIMMLGTLVTIRPSRAERKLRAAEA